MQMLMFDLYLPSHTPVWQKCLVEVDKRLSWFCYLCYIHIDRVLLCYSDWPQTLHSPDSPSIFAAQGQNPRPCFVAQAGLNFYCSFLGLLTAATSNMCHRTHFLHLFLKTFPIPLNDVKHHRSFIAVCSSFCRDWNINSIFLTMSLLPMGIQ